MGIQRDLYIRLVSYCSYNLYPFLCYIIISPIEARCKESAKILMKYNDRIPVSVPTSKSIFVNALQGFAFCCILTFLYLTSV